MRHAARAVVAVAMAVLAAAALSRVERFVDGDDDVGHRDVFRTARQVVAAARAAHRLHDFVAAQLAEQLLQIRQRNFLALADAGERDWPCVLAHGKVNHGGDGKTAFSSQTHRCLSGRVNFRSQK